MKKILSVNKHSWRFKIGVFCTILFLLPVIVIIGLYFQSTRVIKKQTVLQNRQVLEQMTQLMDSAVFEMKEICIAVSGLGDIKEYVIEAQNDHNLPYSRYKLVRNRKPYKTEKIKDIFVYYTYDDYVLSGIYGALNKNTYC